jgi:TP901 family phage tail tape measure protein
MSNKEQVNLNINIQLQHIREAFAELKKVQNVVKNITITNNKTFNGNSGSRTFVKNIYSNMEKAQHAADQKVLYYYDKGKNVVAKNLTAVDNVIAQSSQKTTQQLERDIKRTLSYTDKLMIDTAKTQVSVDEQTVKTRNRIDYAYAKTKIDIEKNAANVSQKAWTDSIKQAFSIHIIQMYVAPFVQALNQLLQTTLTTFAEFDAYYADYLAKSIDFKDVVSRETIFAGGVNQVYSINNMADAMERFSASGIDLTQNQQALTDVLELSVTAAISYDEAANAVIKTQEAFKLSIEDSTMIVDALTNAANSSTAELKDLTEWFGYASGMAHETGINVQQLAAYLGILSSTGMKSAGTAIRQMLVQMTDANVREKLDAIFGQKFDYMQMDETLLKMREFVQNSSSQAEVMQRISNALGGKVNAREALSRLLTADEATWSRIMTATERSGTAAALFDTMTNNAAGNLSKIKNNITIILAQIGEAFSPILKVLVVVTGWIANFINAAPKFSKYLLGGLLLLAGAFAAIITALATLVGLFYMSSAAVNMFDKGTLRAAFSLKSLAVTMTQLSILMFEHVTVTEAAAMAEERLASATNLSVMANKNMKYGMLAGVGAMASYMGYQYAMEQQAYSLAFALNLVTSALSGIAVGATIGGPVGALLGGAVGLGSAYMGQSNIDRAKEESTLSRRQSAWYGKNNVTQYNDTGAKNYFSISTMNVNGVQDTNTLATELLYESDY